MEARWDMVEGLEAVEALLAAAVCKMVSVSFAVEESQETGQNLTGMWGQR